MLAATRSSSMELPRPKGPPKYQRRSRCFPLPICGSRMAPLLRWACRLMRLRVDFEVSQTSIAVAGDMPHSSSLRATFAVERSTMLPDVARTTILARDQRKKCGIRPGYGTRGISHPQPGRRLRAPPNKSAAASGPGGRWGV